MEKVYFSNEMPYSIFFLDKEKKPWDTHQVLMEPIHCCRRGWAIVEAEYSQQILMSSANRRMDTGGQMQEMILFIAIKNNVIFKT